MTAPATGFYWIHTVKKFSYQITVAEAFSNKNKIKLLFIVPVTVIFRPKPICLEMLNSLFFEVAVVKFLLFKNGLLGFIVKSFVT
jgi:hypothetical protein